MKVIAYTHKHLIYETHLIFFPMIEVLTKKKDGNSITVCFGHDKITL